MFCFLFFKIRQTAAVRICFLKFMESDDVAPALSLSNTVFIDRALVVIPYATSKNNIVSFLIIT